LELRWQLGSQVRARTSNYKKIIFCHEHNTSLLNFLPVSIAFLALPILEVFDKVASYHENKIYNNIHSHKGK